tara:strand:+ start:122 stop:286 length:165 start_codon:yes stop_codon:yes gene_type:complete
VIFKTPAECGIKMKDWLNLLHRNGISEPQLSVSTISVEFEGDEVWLHESHIFIE